MKLNFDLSKLTGGDLMTLALALGILLVVFALLLFSQRKYLSFLRRTPQYKIDAERYQARAAEAAQYNAEARERLARADQLLSPLKARSGARTAPGKDDDGSGDEPDAAAPSRER